MQVRWIWRFIENTWELILSRRSCCAQRKLKSKADFSHCSSSIKPQRGVSTCFYSPFMSTQQHGAADCELVKDDGKTRWLCCFQSGAVSMALCASLSPLRRYTVGLSAFPLSGPPSLPKPSYSPLFLCLVFCLRPSLIRCAGSNFPIYKHLKYLPLWLPLARFLKNIQQPNSNSRRSELSDISTGRVCLLPSHITILSLLPAHSPLFACQHACLLAFLMHCGRFVWR